MNMDDKQGCSNSENSSIAYRINILDLDDSNRLKSQTIHWSGCYLEGAIKEVICPNCLKPVFPVFKLNLQDDRIKSLGLWDDDFLQILVCASCPFYLQPPYWVCFSSDAIEIVGGLRDKNAISAYIEHPFESRAITLETIQGLDYDLTPEAQEMFLQRSFPQGVYHQIGGLPLFGYSEPLECFSCKKPMMFAGMVDYDDLNVPLYETGHVPVALIIGDSDRLYFFTCRQCSIVGFQYVY
jgi:hypothetical protein